LPHRRPDQGDLDKLVEPHTLFGVCAPRKGANRPECMEAATRDAMGYERPRMSPAAFPEVRVIEWTLNKEHIRKLGESTRDVVAIRPDGIGPKITSDQDHGRKAEI